LWVAQTPSRRASRPDGLNKNKNKNTTYYSHCSEQRIITPLGRKKDRLSLDVRDLRPSATCTWIESVSSTIH
jgi:hypothetical protein